MLEQERIACAIVSAALKSDLDRVVFKRRWDGYFQAVCGAGRRKIEHIEELLATGTLTRDVMYFGDSRIDMEAAEATGCTFVFVSSASEWDDGERVCRSRGHGVIQDFRDALSWW
jgi:phosphoglycolate phosphatase-like HAD superfamily hydrolase